MDNFSELLKEAIAGGDDLESAMRKAANRAAKEAVESLLRTEVRTLLGYGKYAPEGRNSGDSRNGSYERTVQTSVGPITVRVPRDRNGDYSPKALPRYQRRTDLVTSVILKLYSCGMTDEEMRLAIGSIYEANCSKSAISAITDAVVADVKRFSERPLPKRLFALFLDSTYVPVRRDSVAKEAINIAMGVDDDGVPLVVGYSITPEESAEAYRELLAGFKSRGLEEVEVAVTDGLSGIDEAVSESYPRAKRQRCFVHLLRNILSKVRAKDRPEAADDFAAIARQRDMESGKAAMASFVAKWRLRYPRLAIWAEEAENVLTFYEFPEGLRKLVYTNNRIESFNKQIKRMVKKQIQFVTEEALEKRIVSMFLHYNDDPGKRKVRCWREIVAYYESK